MKIKDVQLSVLRTELNETVIPTRGAVDKLPELVLVSVSTHEGIDGHYVSYLIPAKAAAHAAEVAKTILVGRDTYDVAALSHEMTNALPPYSNPPALAGADACLWDINAKGCGSSGVTVPVGRARSGRSLMRHQAWPGLGVIGALVP